MAVVEGNQNPDKVDWGSCEDDGDGSIDNCYSMDEKKLFGDMQEDSSHCDTYYETPSYGGLD